MERIKNDHTKLCAVVHQHLVLDICPVYLTKGISKLGGFFIENVLTFTVVTNK